MSMKNDFEQDTDLDSDQESDILHCNPEVEEDNYRVYLIDLYERLTSFFESGCDCILNRCDMSEFIEYFQEQFPLPDKITYKHSD